ncbi:DUF4190 domain-containing protein [Paenibacillus sepulcri]|uniref:DUF4190 domain-containing protein n=1 Tax=Paenibacillus sepulcri TaxID=359917 RepID=A0ABS7C0X1_9BACL|nr:DUF4190 domain-containing protein [Paenibacillus sepulcri]
MEQHSEHESHDDSHKHHSYGHDHHPYNEEMSAELAVPPQAYQTDHTKEHVEEAVEQTRSAGQAAGWAALVLSVLSWFVWPLLLGATGIVVGFIAYRQDARGLGLWSMILGLISVIAYLVIIPLYYSIT